MKATNNTMINSIMRTYMKYICAVLMILGVSVNSWGTTTDHVYLPAGSNSSYSAGDWGAHGAPFLSYPSSETEVTICASNGYGFDMSFYDAADYNTANGLQLNGKSKGDMAYVSMTIASTGGVSVKVTYSCASEDFTISLTGTSDQTVGSTGSGLFESTTLTTTSTSATLTITGTSKAVYIKYIEITRKGSTGGITIDHDDCVFGPSLSYDPASLSETITVAEALSGGSFSTVNVTGVNLDACSMSYYDRLWYDLTDKSGASGTYGDDWSFEVIATSSSGDYSEIDESTLSETLTINYYFYTTPTAGTYSAKISPWYWDGECENYIEFEELTISVTVADACTADPTIGAASVSSSFTLSSNTGAITASSGTCGTGSGCEWVDYGFVWGTTSTPTVSNNKVQVGTSGSGTSWNGSIQPSGSTSPTTWSTGTTYYVRTYGKNGKDAAAFTYGTATSFSLQSIAFNSNGGSSVGTIYVKSGGAATKPSDPTKTGYDFGGWYTDDGTFENAVNWSSAVSENKTYYAKWTAKDISLTLNKNNSDVSGSSNGSASVKYDATSLTSISHATRTGYSLEGYYAEAGCTNKVLTKDGELVNYTGYVVSDKWARTTSPTTLYAKWTAITYTDYRFSCSELTLEAHPETAGAPIFITSVAEKKVRSQGYITISGSGLTPSTTLTFPGLDSKFEIKAVDGTAIATDANGEIDDVDAYIFYTPAEGATSDGLDKLAGITVSVSGAKPKQVSLTQSIIGRHLPTAGYVIAGKKDNKWYAMPSNMASTTNPKPSEIAVDDLNNPSIAYTATTNIYGLEGPTTSGAGNNLASGNSQYVRLTMSIDDGTGDPHAAPLFGSATGTRTIGKSGNSQASSHLSAGWWWELKQTNTSITNPQDAKYTIRCANNTSTLSLRDNAGNPDWGLFASGVEELRLIPASDIPFTEAYFVEWGQHGGVIEVDAEGIDATSVVAHLGAATSSAITLSQTLTNGKGRATIYNYTVNFGNDINFAATASNGALLTLEWKNGATTKAMTSLVVPKIIASTSTLSSLGASDGDWSSAEVHVLPGVTLTANAGDFTSNDVMIRHLEIYPGATVVVTKGSQASGTLKVKTLVLRNGWTRAGAKRYDVARLYITPSTASLAKNAPSEDVWYTDWYIDYDQYYPIAVPWDVTLANITYRYCSVEPTVGHDKNIRLRYYDGSSRAGGGAIGTNWKLYGAAGAESVPTKLEPSKGYALTAKRPSGKAFSILRMPLTIPSADWTAGGEKGEVSSVHKNQVSVTGWGSGTAQWYAMGWNFIGNPYMCTFNGNDDGISGKLVDQQGKGVRYATIPDVDFKNFDQVAIADADLKPASGFFVQAENPEATYITFESRNIVPPSAPARFTTVTENIPDQEAYIRLSYEGGKDQMGLIIGEDYTANYEVNADLAKVLGDAGFVKTYMQYGGMDMAYVAINEMLAKEWIPVTVILPANGEYTYSLTNSSIVNELEGVYLIDYANENKVTNLINQNYIFTAEAGTISNRFAINAIVGERQIPTDIDVVNGGGDLSSDKPFKFIYHEKVYIYHRGVIYDATGKRVKEINK